MFFVSWSVSVFMVDFQSLSNRSNVKNIARVGKRKTHIQKSCYIPPIHHPPPTTPHPCPWRRYTGNVRDKQADRCSPLRRRLVCGVYLEASQGLDVPPISRWRWVSWKSLRGPCMAGDHAARWGKRGQFEEENSRCSSPVGGGRILLGIDWFSSRSGSGFGWGPEFSECPSSPPPFSLGQSGDNFFSHFCFLFCLGGFCLLFLTCFRSVLDFIRPFWFCFIVGFLDCY